MAFNVPTLDCAYKVYDFAIRSNRQIIIQTSPKIAEYYSPELWVNILKSFNNMHPKIVFLHLDHCNNIELINECISVGYDSVMVDGSSLPLEENINLTKQVVKVATGRNCLVEGEVGMLKELGEGNKTISPLTNPDDAGKFVYETNVDLFAPAFGNAHGRYRNTLNRLDFALLREISERVNTPLVLHGGSGLTYDEIRACIYLGVTKINVSTDLKEAFEKAVLKKNVHTNHFAFNNLLNEEYLKVLEHYFVI